MSGTNVFLEKEGMAWDRRGDADAVGVRVRDQGDRSEMGEVRSGAEADMIFVPFLARMVRHTEMHAFTPVLEYNCTVDCGPLQY